METVFHRRFVKQYAKLPLAQKKRLEKAISLFEDNPNNPILYDHALTGNLKDHRSMSFGGDWRAHYLPQEDGTALFVAIGTHSQLYK